MSSEWRKSSYSGGMNNNCVEVATWRKSTYSGGSNNACVEVASWRKSTYSGGMNNACVEVAAAGAVLIRDTTNRDGVTLSVSVSAWSKFTSAIR